MAALGKIGAVMSFRSNRRQNVMDGSLGAGSGRLYAVQHRTDWAHTCRSLRGAPRSALEPKITRQKRWFLKRHRKSHSHLF